MKRKQRFFKLSALVGCILLGVGIVMGSAHKSPQGAHTSHETQTGPSAGNSTQKG